MVAGLGPVRLSPHWVPSRPVKGRARGHADKHTHSGRSEGKSSRARRGLVLWHHGELPLIHFAVCLSVCPSICTPISGPSNYLFSLLLFPKDGLGRSYVFFFFKVMHIFISYSYAHSFPSTNKCSRSFPLVHRRRIFGWCSFVLREAQ